MFPFHENTAAVDQNLALGVMVAGLLADHILVACRLLGLLVTLPGLNGSALPWHLKCILLVVTAAIITPSVSPRIREASRQLTTQDAEHPVRTVAHEEVDLSDSLPIDGRDSPRTRPSGTKSIVRSGLDFVRLAGCEGCLGVMLGLGAYSILQGLRMAGQLIDQQTGWNLVASPAIDQSEVGTVGGELLFGMGTVMLFVLGGHLLLVSTLLETFRTFPPGGGELNVELVPALSQLVRQSLGLALQLSAPLIATQILAGLIVSHASGIAPQFQQSGAGTVVRLVLATLVLLLTLSGLAERMLDLLPMSVGWAPSPSVFHDPI